MSNTILLSPAKAGKEIGVSKPTIARAIKSGRLSAIRREDGSWGIDPAELMRWKEAHGHRHDEPEQAGTPDPVTLQVENARITAELAGARALMEAERLRADTAERDRDRWHAAFLALPRPKPKPEPQTETKVVANAQPKRRGFFSLFAGKENRV